jgi:trk system potassium uptake protein TrkA
VVGLGRFGSALALELEALGHEVLAVDERENVVQSFASDITHAVVADATDVDVLRGLGVADLDHAVVAIGEDIEASILCTGVLSELEVRDVWAKANTESHARILRLLGADHVIFPERDTGQRIAHQVMGRMRGYVEIDDNFALVEVGVPDEVRGQTLVEAQLRARYGVTVVAVKPERGLYRYTAPDSLLEGRLLVAGAKADVERFAERAPVLDADDPPPGRGWRGPRRR